MKYMKVGGLISGSCSVHVEVSLGKTLNPKLPLMAELSVYGGLHCVNVHVNGC